MIESVQKHHSQQTTADAARARTVLVSGSSGLVGQALLRRLDGRGDRTIKLVRSEPAAGEVRWNPWGKRVDKGALAANAVVHLAGENIANGRWTPSKMEAIRSSRVQGTRLLAEGLAALDTPPEVLVSASAIGFYGERGDKVLTESSEAGQGFLAQVCQEWEQAVRPASDAGIRCVQLRIGVVLDRNGGGLAKMLLPFRLGAGGRLGSGNQYMSWILLDDLVSAICMAIDDERLEGPVNATAPHPVTNQEFTKALGKLLRRPTVAPLPGFAARLAFGKMADELLLASIRVSPEKLMLHRFEFDAPDIEGALRMALGK